MKSLIQVLYIFLILSFINFGCTFGDKYLGTWENVTDGDQITISKHKKKGNMRTSEKELEETICYEIEYKGDIYYGGRTLGEGVFINYGFDRYNYASLQYEESTGYLKCVGGCRKFDGEWKRK